MIIDAHNHPDWHGHDLEKTLANMDRYGIDKAWMLSWETPPGDYDPNYLSVLNGPLFSNSPIQSAIPFERCLAYVQKAPERFVLGYAPNPARPDAVDCLKGALNIYHIQVCGEIKFRLMYDNPDCIDLFRFCGEAKLPVTLHFDYAQAQLTGVTYPRRHWWYGGSIDTLERMLQLCPDTNFLGHAPGFWCHISNDEQGLTQAYPTGPVVPGGRIEQLLEQYSNLYCDISAGSGCRALSRDPEYTVRLITRFPDRFVYARDYFDNIHQELIESLQLPQDVKELIYHGNAERLVCKA